MDKPDFSQKCYRTKDDKLHSTIFYRGNLEEETESDRERRLEVIHNNRGRWVWDETKGEVVRAEDYHPEKKEIDAPSVSLWNPEFSVIATGKRMSKGELKQYCRQNGKNWIE
ncbi:MAG: hypothetical protein ABID54_08930 [Pseudomonadota bacterium]